MNAKSSKAEAQVTMLVPTGSVSNQIDELIKEVRNSVVKLKAVIDNRSAWKDAADGCREGVAVLDYTHERLQAIGESAQRLEAVLLSARNELERWSKMHADLSVVERELRAQCEAQREMAEEQRAVFSRARMLLRDFSRDLTKELT